MNFNSRFGITLTCPRWLRVIRWRLLQVSLDDAIRSGNKARQRRLEVPEIKLRGELAKRPARMTC